jgi:hypothetical protein
MKQLRSILGLIAAISLAAPVTGFSSSGDHDSHGDHGRDFHGRFYSSGYRGHYYFRGPRFYFGGGPFFWGPSVGFSYYSSPDYAYDNGPAPQYYRGAPVARGNVQDDLGVDVQKALTEHGYYHGAVDGEIGSGSRAAIRAYQHDHGLEVTGRIDNALLRSLHIE